MAMLEREFTYYLNNQSELVKKYAGKFIVIKDEEVVGAFDSHLEAYEDSVKKYALGLFLIQHCEAGSDSYTQMFHSRVLINKPKST
jgi:hypothetical protein